MIQLHAIRRVKERESEKRTNEKITHRKEKQMMKMSKSMVGMENCVCVNEVKRTKQESNGARASAHTHIQNQQKPIRGA